MVSESRPLIREAIPDVALRAIVLRSLVEEEGVASSASEAVDALLRPVSNGATSVCASASTTSEGGTPVSANTGASATQRWLAATGSRLGGFASVIPLESSTCFTRRAASQARGPGS
jgi:hypothetical protein